MEVSAVNVAAGALFYAASTRRFLFLLRNQTAHANTWGLVGGSALQGETPAQCLQRETLEELGYQPAVLKTVPLETYTSGDGKFQYHTYVCVVEQEFIPQLNNEHQGYCWCSLEFYPRPLHPGLWSTIGIDVVQQKIQTLQSIADEFSPPSA